MTDEELQEYLRRYANFIAADIIRAQSEKKRFRDIASKDWEPDAVEAVRDNMKKAALQHENTLNMPGRHDTFTAPNGEIYTGANVRQASHQSHFAKGKYKPSPFKNRRLPSGHPTHPNQYPIPHLGHVTAPENAINLREYPVRADELGYLKHDKGPARAILSGGPTGSALTLEGVLAHNSTFLPGDPGYNDHFPTVHVAYTAASPTANYSMSQLQSLQGGYQPLVNPPSAEVPTRPSSFPSSGYYFPPQQLPSNVNYASMQAQSNQGPQQLPSTHSQSGSSAPMGHAYSKSYPPYNVQPPQGSSYGPHPYPQGNFGSSSSQTPYGMSSSQGPYPSSSSQTPYASSSSQTPYAGPSGYYVPEDSDSEEEET